MADAFQNNRNRLVELSDSFFFRRRIRIGEFPRTVTDVAAPRNLRADVVVQIAGQMQNEVAEAVSVGEGVFPKLPVRQGCSQFVDSGSVRGVALGENRIQV